MPAANPEALVASAVTLSMSAMTRLDGREVGQGPHELREVAPALADALREGAPLLKVGLEWETPIENWTRPTTVVDVAAAAADSDALSVAIETKVWDIGHQLFDLAKVCCLLGSGVESGFLVCVAYRPADFDSKPGGVLFPATAGVTTTQRFEDLIATYRGEWSRHVGNGGPEPTSLPSVVSTTAVVDEVAVAAYPGHVARAVAVAITDARPVPLPTAGRTR